MCNYGVDSSASAAAAPRSSRNRKKRHTHSRLYIFHRCVSSCGKKGCDQTTLIGTFWPPATPICMNSHGAKIMYYGIDAVQVQEGGRDPRMPQSELPGYAPFSLTMMHTNILSLNEREFEMYREQRWDVDAAVQLVRSNTYSAL
ncbi:hypothetical protein Y032_0039g4 [Ancylostoma ceylanicum]|uniref:Uncharacterized protein n=1 Tax=Ancylostoma ceylanicum TaxID=53326 RepID=A0A016UHJ6_9BILA|nr:hypothetical protein Y032_0039g4 [Ancylostoma ceylanicum]